MLCLFSQSRPTLCDPMVCSPPGSSVHGISQVGIWSGLPFPFSRLSSWPRNRTHVSCKSPALQEDSLLLSYWGSPKTILGSLPSGHMKIEKERVLVSSPSYKVQWDQGPMVMTSLKHFLRIFLMSTVKVFIKFILLFLLYILIFWPQGIWNLNSPTRDWTFSPCIGRKSFNHWTAREVPWLHWNLIAS